MITEQEIKKREELWELGYWEIPDGLDVSHFNFAWRPYKFDRPYIHQFGTQHQKTGGPKFIIPNNEGIKYQDFQHAIKLPDRDNRCWRPLLSNATIDFSWHPDETEPPFIYVFGNQWHDAQIMPTYQYRVKGATEKKYVENIKATLLPNKSNWKIPDDIDDSAFDYSWVPNPYEPPINWVFGTQWQKTGGPVFYNDNAIGSKYVDFQKVQKIANKENRCWRVLKPNLDFDFSWHPDETDPPYIYIFGNQWYDAETMPSLMYRVKGAVDKKYVTDLKCELLPNKSKWNIPDDIENDFDYSWLPHPHEPPLIWQFGTQWQKTGGPQYIADGATVLKYTDELKAKRKSNIKKFRIIEPVDKEDFDFTWHPDDTEEPYNYIFGNDIHSYDKMPTLMYKSSEAVGTKYIDDIKPKLKIEEVLVNDSIFDSVISDPLNYKFNFFGIEKIEFRHLLKDDEELNVMHIIDNVAAVIPKEAKTYVYDKLYDYPYIKYHNLGYRNRPLDIIFLSNGEKGSEENYEHLLNLVRGLPNNIIGIKDIQGRVASQHEAANMASTPWYFLINGKCKVNPNFDFSWQPDRMCTARHYIFRATNPVNGLEYGHMAIVANNKRLTLNTKGTGLDFTLESPHQVVDINSGIGVFNTSKWDTWRTSFREVIKLKHNVETINDKASLERLTTWLTIAEGAYAEWSIKGSHDAIEYYESVHGDFEKLKLSYDWECLHVKFNIIIPK